jgi:NlpC/P60 family
MSHVEALADGYQGYVYSDQLGETTAPTHRVTAVSTYVLSGADVKFPSLAVLPYGAAVTITGQLNDYLIFEQGYLYAPHMIPLTIDHVTDAERFLNVPYLWGGTSAFGLDCSGLIQTVLGGKTPRDSKDQMAYFDTVETPSHGDLVFWAGHVALLTSESKIIHANAYSMSVSRETLSGAIARIGQPQKFARPHHRLHVSG